jgi:hypothetical protein
VPLEVVPDPRDGACDAVSCDDAKAVPLINPRETVLNAWLIKEFGLTLLQGEAAAPPLLAWPRPAVVYWIASGTSPRDASIYHAVVFGNDKLCWDPHPSRKGLVGAPKRWAILAPLGLPLY